MGAAKFIGDTLRTVSDMVDVVVVRAPVMLDRQLVGTASVGSVINGGDVAGRHPTQAIIELFAIEQLVGPIGELRMGLRGNLQIQACRWFYRLLNLVPPTEFVLVAPEGRCDHGVILSRDANDVA